MLHVIHEIERQIFVRSSTREILRLLDDARETVRGSLRDQMGEPAAAALTLKLLNLLLARHHFQARSTTVHSRPYGLLVDPSNGCNLACPGCVQSAGAKSLRIFDWHNGLIDERRFATLLERFGPCTLQIMFCNYGEPLTNSNTPRLIEMAKGYLIRTVLSTNLAVPKFDAEAYIRSGLDFMFLAIDGATQPTYSRYRKNGQLAVVFRNIEALVKAKRRLGSPTPTLRWQFLAFEHNRHEIPEALEVARAFGLDQFAVETPFDVSWDDPEVRSARDVRPFQEVFQQAAPGEHRMAPEAAALIERELDRGWVTRATDEEVPVRSLHTCAWLYRSMTIDANGRILPCCGAPKPGVDVVFGSSDCPDAFNTAHYRQARRWFRDRNDYELRVADGSPAPYCAKCEWNQTHTEFGPEEAAQYFRYVAGSAIDAATLGICCNW